MASSSSSSTTVEVKKHDVFLSFCGVDTRNTFTSTLCGILKSRSINVFIDDELERGEHISSSLMNEISDSMISVIIFSEGYASSRWCLEELVKILECRDTQKQGVIPVFYHIYPSDVRNLTGNFGEGFKKLVESYDEEKLKRVQMTEEQFKDMVLQWKNALTEAANISGPSTEEIPFDYGLYVLELNDLNIINSITNKRFREEINPRLLWHHRFGHIGENKIMRLEISGILNSLGSELYPTCESCLQGKLTKLSFKNKGERSKELLELIHSDVHGPFAKMARGGIDNKYNPYKLKHSD